MLRKVIWMLALLLASLAYGQSPVMELSYYPAPASHSSTVTTVVNTSPLQYFVIVCGWGSIDVDGNPAHYNWTSCENSINDYLTTYAASACAKACIQLVFSPANDISPNSSAFTPTYVMTNPSNTVCECPSYAGNGNIAGGSGCQTGSTNGDAGTASPVPFSAPFATAYNNFVTNAVAHLKLAAYLPYLVSVTFGEQRGGENIPTCSSQLETFFSYTVAQLEAVWQTMNDTLNASFAATKPPFLMFDGIGCIGILQPSTGNNCDLAAKTAATHAKYGIGLRVTCARATDLTNLQGNAPTCGDWVNQISQYAVPLDVQDSTQSDPSGGTCTIGGQASKVGLLQPLLVFIMQHRGKATRLIFEGLSTDWNGAYSGNTNACWPVACGPSGYAGGCPYAPYDLQWKAAALGQPTGTIVTKRVNISGGVTIY